MAAGGKPPEESIRTSVNALFIPNQAAHLSIRRLLDFYD